MSIDEAPCEASGDNMSTSLCYAFNAGISPCDFLSTLKLTDINPISQKKEFCPISC